MSDQPAFDLAAACADEKPQGDALARVTALVQLMADASRNVDDLANQLTAAKADLKRIEQDDLPDLMRELGIADIKLADGSRVEVLDDVHCGISEERRAEAHAWLTANGFGGLIKTNVSVAFDREEAEEARELAARLREELEQDVALAESVHPATLKSFVKEQLEAEANPDRKPGSPVLPRETFAVFQFAKAKVHAAKAKKVKGAKK